MDFSSEDFLKNGVAVFPEAVSIEALLSVRSRIDDLVTDFDPDVVTTVFSTSDQGHARDDYFLTSGNKVRYFLEEGAVDGLGALVVDKERSLNKIGHALHDLDPVFDRFFRSEPFAAAASAVGMVEPLLLQSMVIFKNPGIGGEVTAHTDHSFLWTEPQSVIGFWLAVDEATEENGCLWARPGAHVEPVRTRFVRTPDGKGTELRTLDDAPHPDEGWVPLEASPGTLIALHGTLPHRSSANRSADARLALTLHCVERASEYPENNWLQRDRFSMKGFTHSD